MGFKVSEIWAGLRKQALAKEAAHTFRPKEQRLTGGLAANGRLLRGIYDGSNQDFALGAYTLTGFVKVYKNLIGIPGITTEEDTTLVEKLLPLVVDEYPILVKTMLVLGTAWRWARWSDKLRRLVWEAIPDDAITQIVIDPDTQEILELYTDEYLEYYQRYQAVEWAQRRRHITREKVTEEWLGKKNQTVEYANRFGYLPVAFGRDCWEGEWRGDSVFARALRSIKSTHDITYQRDEILATFKPKLIQTLHGGDARVAQWRRHNNLTDGKAFDPYGMDFVINQEGDSTTFLSPGDMTSGHNAAIKDNERRIIITSGLPQLFFGELTTGTQAGGETQAKVAVDNVKDEQRGLLKPTLELVNQSLGILAYMNFTRAPRVSVGFGALDLMSAEQKARVLGMYASAVSTMVGSGTLTADGALYFTKLLFSDFPVKDKEELVEGMKEMLAEVGSRTGQAAYDTGELGL